MGDVTVSQRKRGGMDCGILRKKLPKQWPSENKMGGGASTTQTKTLRTESAEGTREKRGAGAKIVYHLQGLW